MLAIVISLPPLLVTLYPCVHNSEDEEVNYLHGNFQGTKAFLLFCFYKPFVFKHQGIFYMNFSFIISFVFILFSLISHVCISFFVFLLPMFRCLCNISLITKFVFTSYAFLFLKYRLYSLCERKMSSFCRWFKALDWLGWELFVCFFVFFFFLITPR